jgi:hypothetical protein
MPTSETGIGVVLQQVELYLFKHMKQLVQLHKLQLMDGEQLHGDLKLGELKDQHQVLH